MSAHRWDYIRRTITVIEPSDIRVGGEVRAEASHGTTDRASELGLLHDSQLQAKTLDLLDAAWGLIANAGGGEWANETDEWQDAAVRWRERYHAVLSTQVVAA